MKYPFEFKKNVRTSVSLLFVFATLILAYNLLCLLNVFPFFSRNVVVEAISLAAAALIICFLSLVTFGSGFVVTDTHLIVKLAFLSIKKIGIEKITNIREYKSPAAFVLGFVNGGGEPQAVNIFIAAEKQDSFVKELKGKNASIIFDIVDKAE